VILLPSALWHCWLGDRKRKDIQPVENWCFGLLVVTIWLELYTSYSSSCHHSPPFPSSIAPFKFRILIPVNTCWPGKWPIKLGETFLLFPKHFLPLRGDPRMIELEPCGQNVNRNCYVWMSWVLLALSPQPWWRCCQPCFDASSPSIYSNVWRETHSFPPRPTLVMGRPLFLHCALRRRSAL